MKNYYYLFFGICLLLANCAQNDTIDEQSQEALPAPININLTANELIMTKDGKDFAFSLFSKRHNLSTADKNIILSPFSLNMALAVLRNGAAGETKAEIEKVIGMNNLADSEINDYYLKIRDALVKTDPSLKLAIANSIWYDKDFVTVNNSFADLGKQYFDLQITGLDYKNEKSAIATINKWCEDNTNGLIKDMVESLSTIEILNALYFKGNWAEDIKFDA
jgi:serpin B